MAAAGARAERELTGPFWAAVDRGELVRPVCDGCGESFFSPQVVCPHCRSADWAFRSSSGSGRIHSHTTIHRAPDDRFDPPYVIADVELDEGWRMFGWIIGSDAAGTGIGDRVRVCFVDGVDGERLAAFELVGPDSDTAP